MTVWTQITPTIIRFEDSGLNEITTIRRRIREFRNNTMCDVHYDILVTHLVSTNENVRNRRDSLHTRALQSLFQQNKLLSYVHLRMYIYFHSKY